MPRDDGLDRVLDANGVDNEPEKHVRHVNNADSLMVKKR